MLCNFPLLLLYQHLGLLLSSSHTYLSSNEPTKNYSNHSVPHGFLVWSPSCEMPSLEPLANDVMKLFHVEKYEECSSTKPLTYIKKNWTTNAVYLTMNESLKTEFTVRGQSLDCCYQEIIRNAVGKNPDDKFK